MAPPEPVPASPPAQLAGELVGRYRLDREIGRGGMAVVYLARDLRHERDVALKLLLPPIAAALGPERFLREIRVTAALQHPNILPLLDSGAIGDTIFFIAPYVTGGSLRHRLQCEGAIPPQQAIALVAVISQGLAYAHREGVLHRDIKPENILIQSGVPTIADFGIALPIGTRIEPRITDLGGAIGTPEYMSPEQIIGDRPLDERSDQYSLACMLFELLAGHLPFPGITAAATMVRRFAAPVPPVHSPHEPITQGVQDAIHRALALEPRERFPTLSDFVSALVEPSPGMAAAAPRAAPSLAVLPFSNLSSDPDSDYFSDGLTDELIADLSMIRSLRVTSRSSSFRLKGTTSDVRSLGRELDVRYVLSGSVRRSGSNVRVTAQLIDTATDEPAWADKYGGELSDIFAIQERISHQIAEALRVTLTPEQARRIAARPIVDPRALEYYHRTRHAAWSSTPEGTAQALRHARNAIALVGDSDLLHASLGQVHFLRANAGIGTAGEEMAAAEAAAHHALGILPDSAAGLALLGAIRLRRGEVEAAIRTLKGALVHDPTATDALFWLAYAYISTGHGPLARTLVQRLLELDPLTPINHCLLGWIEAYAGRCEDALPHYRRMLELEPENPLSRFLYGLVLLWNSRSTEAKCLFEDLGAEPDATVWTRLGGLFGAALAGDEVRAATFLDPTLLQMGEWQDFFALRLAECHALLGQRESAIRWLKCAIGLGVLDHHFHSRINPVFEPLRQDPEFVALMADAAGRASRVDD